MAEEEKEEVLRSHQQYEDLISSLPVSKGLLGRTRNYKGYWYYPESVLPGVIAFSERFKVRDTDIIVASPPKCGTTWLMALVFATFNRKDYSPSASDHPLLSKNPHDIVLNAELSFSRDGNFSKLEDLSSPRIISTHAPHEHLGASVASSKCRVVYICREPKDTMVSTLHFVNAAAHQGIKVPLSLEEAFDMFCDGKSPRGPIWDHCLGYWRESLRMREKILFLKYEEMMENPLENLRRLAEFVGCPFSPQEESERVPEKIIDLCSFKKLSSTEVNCSGINRKIKEMVVKNSSFFRKGQVGDWKNYLTTEMARKLDRITEKKLQGSGFTFRKPEAV